MSRAEHTHLSRPHITRRAFVAGAASILANPALAQTWPSRPVKVIVPFLAGGITDTSARIACEHLSKMYPQPFIIENRPGAAGNIAADAVIRANDDHVLLFGIPAQIVVAPLLQKLSYDPRKSLKPIARVIQSSYVVAVHPSLGVNTLPELVSLLKKEPGKYNYASSGVGGYIHLVTELFRVRAGVDIVHVPYAGIAPLLSDFLSNRVQIYFGTYADLSAKAEQGQIKFLAVASAKRVPYLPNLPTIAETYPGVEIEVWNGFLGPASLAPGVADQLAASLRKVVAQPPVVETFTKLGIEPVSDSPAEFDAELDREERIFKEVVAIAKLAPS